MPEDDGRIKRTPSEHSQPYVEDVRAQVFNVEVNRYAEQSAIYRDVQFEALGLKSLGIVLTAQCDIEKYTDRRYILLARMTPIAGPFGYWLQSTQKYTEEEILGQASVEAHKPKRKKVCAQFIDKYLRNKVFSYYFLPALPDIMPASFVCCEITQCMQLKDVESLEKICVLRSPFREAVPAYFASFIGRVGTPVYTDDFLEQTLDSICRIQKDA